MSAAAIRGVVSRLANSSADPLPDADLVTAFEERADADAFAALVERHGPTVLGVCRRVLGDAHDAEDAFQAVFLVLARRVHSVRPPGAVGGWLYGVAVRTANKARVAAARRRRREMIAASSQASPDPPVGGNLEHAELQSALDAEIERLPEALRAVVVMCDLHGRTRADAATELGCPEGTVAARLHRGRKKLAHALARRGLALPAAGLVAVLAPATVSAAASRAAVAAALGSAPPAVLALAREVTRGMISTTRLIALGAITLLTGGVVAAALTMTSEPTKPDRPVLGAATLPMTIAAPAPKPVLGWREAKVLDHPGWLVGSAAWSPDGKVLIVGGTDGHVHAYDVATFKEIWKFRAEDSKFAAVAVAPDGKTVAATYRVGVRFLDAQTGKVGDVLEEKGSEPMAVAYFPEFPVVDEQGVLIATRRQLIFASAAKQFAKTWLKWPMTSTITMTPVAAGRQPADDYAVPIAVAPDGKRAIVTGPIDRDTGKNVLWAWAAGSGEGNKLLVGHKAAVTCAAWSKDGKTILTGDAEGVVISWDADNFKEKSRTKLGGRVAAVAVSTDGMQVAAAVTRNKGGPGQGAYAEEVFVFRQGEEEPQGKIIRRMPDGVVEINLGSKDRVEPGAAFEVLPADYPEKGRQSRMRQVRVPDERGSYRTVEKYYPKATIRVTEVVGLNLSRAQIISESEPIRDSAGAGDLLYATIDLPGQGAKPISSHDMGAPFKGLASLAFSPDGKFLAAAFSNFDHLTKLGELTGKVRIFTTEPEREP